MLNKRTIAAIFAVLLLPLAVGAANEVSVPVGETITLVLPSDSSQYTVLMGTFDSVTVNTSNFEFVMSAGSSVEITSADKKNFSVSPDQGTTVECQTSLSKIFISKGAGDSTETVTVTPSGTCVSSSGGGGSPSLGNTGGGGGGGGGSYTPPPAPTPAPIPAPSSAPSAISMVQQQIAAIQARIAELRGGAPAGTPPAYGVFARTMDPGERSDEVHRLQQLLASDSEVYPDGRVTGYYGTLTRDAVRRFQLKYGVIGNSSDLGNGRVGPKTMAKLNEIFGGSQASPAPASPVSAPNSAQINAIMQQIQQIQAQIKALKGQ